MWRGQEQCLKTSSKYRRYLTFSSLFWSSGRVIHSVNKGHSINRKMVIYSAVQSRCYIININNMGIGVHRNFSIDRKSRHFDCPFQAADDTVQMGVHITLYLSTPQRKWLMLRQQSQKFASLATRFLFTSYKMTFLSHLLQSAVIVSLH